jgi:hypothetical protein
MSRSWRGKANKSKSIKILAQLKNYLQRLRLCCRKRSVNSKKKKKKKIQKLSRISIVSIFRNVIKMNLSVYPYCYICCTEWVVSQMTNNIFISYKTPEGVWSGQVLKIRVVILKHAITPPKDTSFASLIKGRLKLFCSFKPYTSSVLNNKSCFLLFTLLQMS